MADLFDKKTEVAMKKTNVEIGKLEKRLEVVYDSIIGINTEVVESVHNFTNLYAVIQDISNVDLSDSKLNASLDALNQNINTFFENLGIVKATLMEMSTVNGLEYNVSISTFVNNTFDASEFVNSAKNAAEKYQKVWIESINGIHMEIGEVIVSLNRLLEVVEKQVLELDIVRKMAIIEKSYKATFNTISSLSKAFKTDVDLSGEKSEENSNGLGWGKVGEIFLEQAIEVLFETLIEKIGDKSTREAMVTWAKKIIQSDALKGALLSLSYMLPSVDDMIVAAVNISGKIANAMPMMASVANVAIPTTVGVAAGYSTWRIHNEGLDLNSKIEELGEEEGRIAAGTDVWDKAAIMQYDINKTNASLNQAYADMFTSIGEQVGLLYEDWTEKMNLHQSNVQLTNETITQTHVGMFTSLGEGARTLYEDGTEKMVLHQTNIQMANEGMTQAYVDMFSKIGEDIGCLYEDWGQKIELYQSDTQTANEAITKSYVDMFTELGVRINKWWNDDVLPLFSEENWTFEGIGTGLSKSIGAGVGAITQGLNTFRNWMENDFSITLNTNVAANGSITKPYGTTIKPYLLQTYEIGGFPEDGLFMANHGELVGKFSNGKTAVANNEQIVSGIKYGVKEAVSEVLTPYLADIAQNTRETANKDFATYIGDKEIARASERGRRAMGLQLITEF